MLFIGWRHLLPLALSVCVSGLCWEAHCIRLLLNTCCPALWPSLTSFFISSPRACPCLIVSPVFLSPLSLSYCVIVNYQHSLIFNGQNMYYLVENLFKSSPCMSTHGHFFYLSVVSGNSLRNISPKNENLLKMYSLSVYPICEWASFFIGTDLKECSITSLAHQWILCSEWVPSEWEFRQLIKTSSNASLYNVLRGRQIFWFTAQLWVNHDLLFSCRCCL